MSHELISRSPDLQRLVDEGYEVSIRANHLVVDSIPYVNDRGEVRRGALVSTLELAGDRTAKPGTHVILFTGEHPCDRHGVRIHAITHKSINHTIDGGLVAKHSFSNKPPAGYTDYFHKVDTYATILWGPAQAIDSAVTPKTFLPAQVPAESVFQYPDTASARSGITSASRKLAGQRIGIIGVGGTGAYVLDFVAKTPVLEIHLFDFDRFLTHNAYRAPGAASLDELRDGPKKVTYLCEKYSKMHRGIVPHDCDLDDTNLFLLEGLGFVFICIDNAAAKQPIVGFLEESGISFVDVGMGTELETDQIGAIVRTTTSTPRMREHFRKRVSMGAGSGDDVYATNIQIAELNALNAVLAVLKWKKLYGFYRDLEQEHHSTYTTDCNQLLSEDQACPS